MATNCHTLAFSYWASGEGATRMVQCGNPPLSRVKQRPSRTMSLVLGGERGKLHAKLASPLAKTTGKSTNPLGVYSIDCHLKISKKSWPPIFLRQKLIFASDHPTDRPFRPHFEHEKWCWNVTCRWIGMNQGRSMGLSGVLNPFM